MSSFVKYEVLYADLENHAIGNYLKSRDFKVFLKNDEAHLFWDDIFNQAKAERHYYSLGMDAEKADSLETLKKVLILANDHPKVENLVTKIIINFISKQKFHSDFDDIIESVKLSDFSEEHCSSIENAVNNFYSKNYPDKPEIEKIKLKSSKQTKPQKNSVFIVHGHNNELKLETARTLDKLGLDPIILHEKANKGQTIIEKFEKHSDVSFAVILITADDSGQIKSDVNLNDRARQNVILEAGYFLAKLGRENLMFLREKDVELPSDIIGIGYTDYDKAGNWKSDLVKELKASGFHVDANKLYQ